MTIYSPLSQPTSISSTLLKQQQFVPLSSSFSIHQCKRNPVSQNDTFITWQHWLFVFFSKPNITIRNSPPLPNKASNRIIFMARSLLGPLLRTALLRLWMGVWRFCPLSKNHALLRNLALCVASPPCGFLLLCCRWCYNLLVCLKFCERKGFLSFFWELMYK